MPPDVREWLPARHLAWFVIDAVGEMDLDGFYAGYRVDGRCRPPYDPAMMVALLLYAYARGMPSSRQVERACVEDVAFRVIAAQQRPDHATIARFVANHQEAIAGLFGEVLTLCARSGLANGRSDRRRWHEGRGERQPQREPRLRADRARTRGAGDHDRRGRGRALWRGARRRAAAGVLDRRPAARGGCGRPRSASRPSARRTRSRCRATGPSASSRPSAASMRSYGPRFAPTGPMRRWRARGVAADGSRRMAPGTAKPYTPPATPQGRVNVDRSGLEGRQGPARLDPGLQRAGGHQRAADRPGRRDRDRRRRLRAPRTDARRRPTRTRRTPASTRRPACCSPTPATGTASRWPTSSTAASRC